LTVTAARNEKKIGRKKAYHSFCQLPKDITTEVTEARRREE
jgi:hypothetical protein